MRNEPNQLTPCLSKTPESPDTTPIKQASAIASRRLGNSHWRKRLGRETGSVAICYLQQIT